jgi:uncharacterized protein YlxP (DUF503 family)
MIVAVSVFEIHIPSCRSLKGKRRVIKPLIERIHQRFRVSIVETDYHDLHQRAEIAIALVNRAYPDAERMMDEIRFMIEEMSDAYLTSWDPEYLEVMS